MGGKLWRAMVKEGHVKPPEGPKGSQKSMLQSSKNVICIFYAPVMDSQHRSAPCGERRPQKRTRWSADFDTSGGQAPPSLETQSIELPDDSDGVVSHGMDPLSAMTSCAGCPTDSVSVHQAVTCLLLSTSVCVALDVRAVALEPLGRKWSQQSKCLPLSFLHLRVSSM